MFGKSVYLLISFLLGAALLWLSMRKSFEKVAESDALDNGKMVDLQRGSYLFRLDSKYRLAVSVDEEGRFSLRLYDRSNDYSNHIRFAGQESFASLTRRDDDVTTVLVDNDCNGLPDFRVIRNEKDSNTIVKENLGFTAIPQP